MSLPPNKKRLNRLVLITLLGLLLIPRTGLAIVAFTRPEAPITVDSAGYLTLAENLAKTGRFQAWEHEEKLRTPGYPFFLAAIMAIFGVSIGPIILVQLFVTLVTAWLIWRQATELFGPRAGLASVFIYALNPNALFWAGTVMTETLFAFWLTLTSFLLTRGLKNKSNRLMAASGLTLSMGVLTRPIGLYLIPLWLIAIFIFLWRENGIRQVVKPLILFFLLAMIPIFAWQTRNAVVHGRFFLSNSGTAAFSNFIVGNVLEEELGIPREEVVGILAEAEDPVAYSIDVLRQYPLTTLRVAGKGILRTLLGTEVGLYLPLGFNFSYEGSGLLSAIFSGDWQATLEALRFRMNAAGDVLGTLLLIWGIGFAVILYILIGLGLIKLRQNDSIHSKFMWFLLAASLAYLLIAPLTIGDARFRVPAEPWLAILAGTAYVISKKLKESEPIESSELPATSQ